MNQALYVFCLVKEEPLHGLEGPGLEEGLPLRLHAMGEMAAVVCPVSLENFSGPEAEDRLQDKDWLMPRICRHEEVVEQSMVLSPVLPLRFGTIFSSPQALEERVRPHRAAIEEFLDMAADREEWAVKGYWDKAQALESLRGEKQRQESERLAAMGPGQRYFLQKKLDVVAKEELSQWLRRTCEAISQSLGKYADEFCQRGLLGLPAGDTGREMAANWAFWVPRDQIDAFKGQLQQEQDAIYEQGLYFECSGPWPPYSFAPIFENGEA